MQNNQLDVRSPLRNGGANANSGLGAVRLTPIRNSHSGKDPEVLVFRGPTKAQKRKAEQPPDLKLEPLSVLQRHQQVNSSDFIHSQNRARFEQEGVYDRLEQRDKQVQLRMKRYLEEKRQEDEARKAAEQENAERNKPKVDPQRVLEERFQGSKLGAAVAWAPTVPVVEHTVDPQEFNGMTDMLEVIEALRKYPDLGFLYLSIAVPKSSVDYHYYNLKVVDYEDCYKPDCCTISLKGVTRMRVDDETDFTPLERFEYEYKQFKMLQQIAVFKLFRKWKMFSVWRKNVLSAKIENCKKVLNENLFILNSSLRPAVLNVREMCYRISDMGLCRIEPAYTYTLRDFSEVQFRQLKEVVERLTQFRDLVKEVIRSACRTALLEAGFTPDDYFIDMSEPLREGSAGGSGGEDAAPAATGSSYLLQEYDIDIYGLAPDKMSYTEQANKRTHCKRLTNFIRLADYLVVNTMHVLAVNSVSTLLNHLTEQLKNTPSLTEIRGWMEMVMNPPAVEEEPVKDKKATEAAAKKPNAPGEEEVVEKVHVPLFLTEFLLEFEQIRFGPSLEEYQGGLQDVIARFKDAVLSVDNLVPDPYFDAFTRPIINNKFEEKMCGEGPSLRAIFDEDRYLTKLVGSVKDAVNVAFNACTEYSLTYEPIRQFYVRDELLDLEALKAQQHDVPFFAEALERYHREQQIVSRIKEKQPVSMFLVDGTNMKARLIPSPERCLDAICDMLPKWARKNVDALLRELQDAQYKLEIEPKMTIDYVEALTFLDQIQERIEPLEAEAEVVKEAYELIDHFKVPTPPEDFAVYQTLFPSINTVKNCIDKVLGERDQRVDELDTNLEKDISELNKEVKELKQEAQNPMILDLNAESEKVHALLRKVEETMIDLQKRAYTFKTYQKQFKLEQTRFDELEEANAELKLKQLLWDSLREWDHIVMEWMAAPLETLDPENLNTTTQKYSKSVYQLEKGLPPNAVVPKLKDKVETIKEKLPVVTDLRNPTMKSRHWEKVEEAIGVKVVNLGPDEPLTLRKLVEINAFSKAEQIQEISAMASSEASLEGLLKKVEDSWKNMEFVTLKHKDYKDVFILGGTDDIQQLWDDSYINVSTIQSSRYVGPIKPRVDEWQRQLDLFNRTLEVWLECQRQWLYLESIFSAPDIQRQLPAEAKMFMTVDKSYKEIMRKVNKMPLAIRAATQPGLLETFQNNNILLEKINKCLEAYLESKRVVFPRFYFLSNEELLEILAQTRNPLAVQPHLRKCFDAIMKLEFDVLRSEKEKSDADGKQTPAPGEEDATAAAAPAPSAAAADGVVYTNDILAMISAEGERVSLGKGLKARGNVEDWLGKVEEAMFGNLRKLLKAAIADFERRERKDWIVAHASQLVLTVAQMMWSRDISEILAGDVNRLEGLQAFEKECFAKLNELAAIVRGELPKLARAVICALITLDVHARDVVTDMVNAGVDSPQSFDWLKQLRYYWDYELDNCVVRMSNSMYVYGYEYLGASPRLVITPLTDRCYLCLMGALQLDLGGAPAGPAGTGKTETCKDMSKSVAKQCVVFNCSDGLDYKMMGKFFSGLAQSGAWCCFDEFNRIDIEVLSVIAQQLITIRSAKASKVTRFMFEGREIKLNPQCAVYITMNPGYAGRTELPDNLKALFRPISMMVPDYKLIAEVILYSEGFENSKHLAQKMTQMYKLCSEQLSQQDHYDFGMRALKSVLVMAGSLKRQNPDKNEDIVLIRALRDSNLPKFLKNDAVLFQAILQDLFPGVEIPEHDYGSLEQEIRSSIRKKQLEEVDSQVKRVIQLYETMVVRHGVMLVGPTGGGKTTVYQVLQDAITTLHAQGLTKTNPFYQPVHTHILNPKAITMGELYGEVNKLTLEWHDGLMGFLVRQAVQDTSEDHHWIVCDSPVDALWIENMNSVLDDNKLLCLANSERIKFSPYMHMVFEVQDLAVASPATVSRCGMVYIDPADIGWMPFVKVWMSEMKSKMQEETVAFLMGLFERVVEDGIQYVNKKCVQGIHMVPLAKVQTLCKLFEVMITTSNLNLLQTDLTKLHPLLATTFVFCYLWGVGGNISDSNWDAFDSFVRQQFEEVGEARLPTSQDLWSCYVDLDAKRMDSWERIVPLFRYNKEVPFFDMLVPTVDTVRFGYLLSKLVHAGRSVLFTGGTGVGKSVIARSTLNSLSQKANYVPLFVNFSAQTSSGRTQEIIESKLEKRRKTILGPPQGKQMVILVDDLNMPKLDRYGAQPPVELLRQIQDFRGFYDRDKLVWKELQDVIICAACGPPGGGRNPVTPRFVRHFSMFNLPAPSEHSLKHMFTAILQGFLNDFPQQVRSCAENVIGAAVEIYNRMATDFLPTPTKSHYVFNLRDLSKCVQGMLQCDAGSMREPKQLYRRFYHESQRVFFDRLNTNDDRTAFYRILSEMAQKYTGEQVEADTFMNQPIVFGDFMKIGADKADRFYDDLSVDLKKVASVLHDYLDDYNMTNGKDVKLVFFTDAIQHVSRIARMIRQDRGNALLVGVGGTGKQSLTRLAAHINSYTCFQIELTRNYSYDSFHDDLKKLYTLCGVQNKPVVFLFTDTQIVVEEFLEDINGILNSGEVPNLFAPDEYEQLIIGCRPAAKDVGIAEGNRDAIYEFCINRVRSNLHVVLCMSPVGSAFRSRCRQFPSLVNCCTIDWFTEWPREALLGVASFLFQPVELGDEKMKQSIAEMCVEIHVSVTDMAERMYAELKRKFYTTPTSYLELINLYLTMLADKKRQLISSRDRVKNGLQKILETNLLVTNMEAELTALEPELRKKSADTEALMEKLAVDQEKADAVRRVVKEDEAVAKVKAEETKAIADDAQRDLNEALPALEASIKSLDALDKNDISEIRVFTKPPELVQTVMEAVSLLLGAKTDWASAKQLLGDPTFLKRLYEYDKDNMSEKLLQKLKVYIDNPQFTPDKVEKVSRACKSMCMWVRAMDLYARVFKTVKPKKERLAAAQSELDAVMATLKEKQNKLKAVEEKIATLQKTYDDSMEQKRKLEHNIQLTQQRLKRAGKLTTSLADERVRWEQTVLDFNAQIEAVIGNVFVAAACVAYEGAFTNVYRQELLTGWIIKCQTLGIPVQDSFSLATVLADAFEIRQWNTDGLPRDQVSVENAILVTRGRRWPLMIDPQEQANRWIKNKEGRNGLKVIKLATPNFMRILENCIRLGIPALLEELGESLDPSLEPILLKQTFVSGGRTLIRLGDQDVDYDKNFRFYMTTKMANPHYLPEICIKVTIINFTVTKSGLEDQLLSEVTRLERPELEQQRNELIVKINTDKNQLKSIEDRILKLLNESEGNILDNVDLINTLNESKVTSAAIVSRLKEAEKTEKQITDARNKYLPVSKRGATMYFVVADMAEVDPMYQFSLKYFKTLFNATIESSEKSSDLETRIKIILTQTTIAVYNNVARGLFEKDKLVFSFMLCAEIMKLEGTITGTEWMTMLRGFGGIERDRPPKPAVPWLTQLQWNACVDLQDQMGCFKGFAKEFISIPIVLQLGDQQIAINPAEYEGYVSVNALPTYPFDESADELEVKGSWNERLSSFQKLILVRCFAEDLVVAAVTQFVKENLGQLFIESPRTDLPALYEDMNNQTPLVFILSQGSDPMNAFLRFARERGKNERVQTISLGQGQGPVAEKLIENAKKFGDWVFLQNCHLASSWMPVLEELIKNLSEPMQQVGPEPPVPLHEEFRLFMSSMPSKNFPVLVLQSSVKVTNEPPKGIRSNLKRAFQEMTPSYFETHNLGGTWRKVVFGICMFHAVVLERRKFGALGFNIRYEFNDSDRECALLNLQMFIQEVVPWDALMYITGEITYGGRVTDAWDQRCLRSILARFFHPDTLAPNHKYSASGVYFAPDYETLGEVREFVDELPILDKPEIFGMHDNANIVYQIQETNALIFTILEVQPRTAAGGGGKSNDEIVFELCDSILEKLIDKIDTDLAKAELFEVDAKGRVASLTTVLVQEIERYNKLLIVIRNSLEQLKKAIRGFVVMSEQLEQVYVALLSNQVPRMWGDAAYPSLKSLGSWTKNLLLRLNFIIDWMKRGQPQSIWISGFFFPQGFLTGVLQTHARKYNLPIDRLSFEFRVLTIYRDQAEVDRATAELKFGEQLEMDKLFEPAADGVIVHGCFMDGFRWNDEIAMIADAKPGEMIAELPIMHMIPMFDYQIDAAAYIAPFYKTAVRAGVLSTTGHSTNFIIGVALPTNMSSHYWILKGSALVSERLDA